MYIFYWFVYVKIYELIETASGKNVIPSNHVIFFEAVRVESLQTKQKLKVIALTMKYLYDFD